jgi:hypothetical protein
MTITADTLRTLPHETLVSLVRTRIAEPRENSTPSAVPASQTTDDVSHYVRLAGVPPVKIQGYPKRRRAGQEQSPRHFHPVAAPVSFVKEFRYEDFFAAAAQKSRVSA